LAQAAAQTGARRFVFCSSVKAVGDPGRVCIDEDFDAAPATAYGRAKREAEIGLLELSRQTGMEVVILRLAVVYGPGSRGNIERMFRLVRRGLFPPLPETGNRRSLVFVDDAVDALLLACTQEAAAGKTFIVAHPDSYSGRELFEEMCRACGKRVPAWGVPPAVLRLLGWIGDGLVRMTGRSLSLDSQVVSRLLDSACYRPDRLLSQLEWRPKYDLSAGLQFLINSEARSPRESYGMTSSNDEKIV
jgi:nucleoside-diphosphate-sugar epimerase